MGAFCGSQFGKEEKTDNTHTKEQYRTEHEKKGYVPAQSRFESIAPEDMILCKLQIQKSRLEKKIDELEKKENDYVDKIKDLLKQGKKEEAKRNLALKKYVITYQNSYRDKLLFIEKQEFQINSLKDTAEFTKVVAETNRMIEGLQAKTNTEEIEIALVLCNEHKAQNAEINAYLEDDELNEEFDDLCKQVEDQGYNNMDKFIKKHTNQEEAEQKYSEQKNEQIKKELSKEY